MSVFQKTRLRGKVLPAVFAFCCLVLWLGQAHAAIRKTGDDDDLSDLQVQRDRKPGLHPAKMPIGGVAAPSAQKAGVLLVDDDASDNNNRPGDTRLSTSDQFYRNLLNEQGLSFETYTVPRYESGPGIDKLRAYRLVIWYTADQYGGNRDNTAVVSLADEKNLRQYLATGGDVILISPGYLSNALGASGEAGWDKASWPFLTEVLGVRGGRGLLQRFKAGNVTATDGTRFEVAGKRDPETQFSALNPAAARTLFTTVLEPDAKGPRPVAVATGNTVGSGRMVYVGFSFEDIASGADAAFKDLLQAAGGAPMMQTRQAAAPSRSVSVPQMSLTGSGPTPGVNVPQMSLTGAGPAASVNVPQMSLAGAGPTPSVNVPQMSLAGSELRR